MFRVTGCSNLIGRKFDLAGAIMGQEISLSRHLVELNDEAEVRETILHEIAHALRRVGLGMGRSGGEWRKRLVACRGDVTATRWCGRVRRFEGPARRVGRWCIGIDGR